MFLHYILPDGEQKTIELGKGPLTIGRSSEADVSIPDKLASRVHCGISFWDEVYFLRDFKSRNGTFVNDRRIDVARLKSGDRIRVGSTTLTLESSKHQKGTETVLKEIKEEMDKGKGYRTMLLEIIKEEKKPEKPQK
jgi:pSer/pThr/pTyr-binding forkhead associated (FHA) protein